MCRPRITDPVEDDPFFDLFCKGLSRNAVAGMEGGIVTIGAATAPHLAVTIGAGEAGIEHNFLKAFAVFLPEISYKGIISLAVWEIIIHYIILKECKITTFNE